MYFTEITYNGSNVLIMCVVGVWRHILDLWCVCVRAATPDTLTQAQFSVISLILFVTELKYDFCLIQ